MKKVNVSEQKTDLIWSYPKRIQYEEQELQKIIHMLTQSKKAILQFVQSIGPDQKISASGFLPIHNEVKEILQILAKVVNKCNNSSTEFNQDLLNLKKQKSYKNDKNFKSSEIKYEDLVEWNLKLACGNQSLAKNLKDTQQDIKKLQNQNKILISELNALKSEDTYATNCTSKTFQTKMKSIKQQQSSVNTYEDQNQDYYRALQAENQQLKLDLIEAQQFIIKNNQEFVRDLQKYNEKVWKLQKDLESTKNILQNVRIQLEEKKALIEKLREDNIKLQLISRNVKNLMSTQKNRKGEISIYTEAAEKSRSGLRQFFKQKLHEKLYTKNF